MSSDKTIATWDDFCGFLSFIANRTSLWIDGPVPLKRSTTGDEIITIDGDIKKSDFDAWVKGDQPK